MLQPVPIVIIEKNHYVDKRIELEKFATIFHQDINLIYNSFEEASDEYHSSLTSKRQAILVVQIESFLKEHDLSSSKTVLSAWVNLGAHGWDRKINVLPYLNKTIEKLKNLQ